MLYIYLIISLTLSDDETEIVNGKNFISKNIFQDYMKPVMISFVSRKV